MKRRLEMVRLDPDRLRRNGVIAYEAILTASAEFFENGTEADRAARLVAWTKAQVNWADDRYGPLRVASMVLHQDEKTPHIHLVVLPLEVKSDRRRTDREPRWSLVGRTISGPGRFDQVQDDYAAAMAPFGLVRGVRGSGRKHEPVPVYLARMARKEQEVDEARIMVISERNALSENRRVLATKAADLDRMAQDQAGAAFRQEREEEDRRRRLDWDRDAMFATVAAERRKVAAERLALKQERIEHAERIAAKRRLSLAIAMSCGRKWRRSTPCAIRSATTPMQLVPMRR
ncbi:plasmid recombination protein [Sphingomonas sp. WKB10]|nr:plasmid recombination protein [Sphingomonas sp. WKB10]